MNQILYEIFKFFMGFLLALVILAGGSVAAALYFVTKLTALPPKPTFANDAPAQVVTSDPKAKPPANQPQAASTQPSASPTSTPTPLPPGAYRARVSWPEGLVLRDKPTYESSTIGGIAYNENVLILEVTSSKEWERVRVESTKEEGWVRGGNTERIGN
jgi:uncharacterized protein YgiM (DUF1202 family)